MPPEPTPPDQETDAGREQRQETELESLRARVAELEETEQAHAEAHAEGAADETGPAPELADPPQGTPGAEPEPVPAGEAVTTIGGGADVTDQAPTEVDAGAQQAAADAAAEAAAPEGEPTDAERVYDDLRTGRLSDHDALVAIAALLAGVTPAHLEAEQAAQH